MNTVPPPSPTTPDLTGMEQAVFSRLLQSTGVVVTRADLTAATYPAGAIIPASNSMEVIVSRLRRKLTTAGVGLKITTLRGRGYRLDPVEATPCT